MKTPQFDFANFLNGYSGLAFCCSVASTLGLTGYYSSLLRHVVPDWVGMILLMAPMVIVLFIQWEEAPDRVVTVAHLVAASWFTILALGMELGCLLGYCPIDLEVFRLLTHLGWTFAWAGIFRRAWVAHRRLTATEKADSLSR